MTDKNTYTPHGNLALNDRRRRLIFRSWHRGIKELDLIFGNFIKDHSTTLTNDDCTWFEKLFEENDHDVLGWITGNKPVPEAFSGQWMDKLKKLDFMKLKTR